MRPVISQHRSRGTRRRGECGHLLLLRQRRRQSPRPAGVRFGLRNLFDGLEVVGDEALGRLLPDVAHTLADGRRRRLRLLALDPMRRSATSSGLRCMLHIVRLLGYDVETLEHLGHVKGGVLDLLGGDERVVGEVLDEAHVAVAIGGVDVAAAVECKAS